MATLSTIHKGLKAFRFLDFAFSWGRLWALLTNTIRALLTDESNDWGDWLADCLGSAAGAVFVVWLLQKKKQLSPTLHSMGQPKGPC